MTCRMNISKDWRSPSWYKSEKVSHDSPENKIWESDTFQAYVQALVYKSSLGSAPDDDKVQLVEQNWIEKLENFMKKNQNHTLLC